MDLEIRTCQCADPENCTERVPGYRCKKDFMPKASSSNERLYPWPEPVETLSITHIFDGEEVITAGEDGQTWIATFASRGEAEEFVKSLKAEPGTIVVGERRADRCIHGRVVCEPCASMAVRKATPVETSPERPVRFDLSRSDYDEWSMCPDGTGDYVRWDDVEQFFERPAAEPPTTETTAQPDARALLKEARPYMQHDRKCWGSTHEDDCDCGFVKIAEKLEAFGQMPPVEPSAPLRQCSICLATEERPERCIGRCIDHPKQKPWIERGA